MQAMKWLGVVLLFPGSVVAADGALDAIRRCTQVKDSLERLVCFDRAAAEVAPPVAVPAPVPATTSSPAPAAVVPSLGAESLRRSTAEREVVEPTSLTATISALKEIRPGTYRISLDNGQVWQQMDMNTLFIVNVGDVVEIEKGRIGGYRMGRVGKGSKGSVWVRVSRLQ